MRAVGDSSVLGRLASEGLSFAKKPKNSKKKGKNLEGENKENCADNNRDFNGELVMPDVHHFLPLEILFSFCIKLFYFSDIYYLGS